MKLNNYHIPTAAYFIIAALFIAYFFPRSPIFSLVRENSVISFMRVNLGSMVC